MYECGYCTSKGRFLPQKIPYFRGLIVFEDFFQDIVLAMRYFRAQLPENYRLRYPVSLLSSERDQVVPGRTNHQNDALKFFVNV
jgi:hypothetical protein